MVLQVLGFCVGLIYLWWEYHADSKVWLASVVMPAISMWIYFSKGLYADFAINIYYLIIGAYGFILWTKGKERKKSQPLPITHIPFKVIVAAIGCSSVLWFLIWGLLTRFTDSTVPIADAFTTALSIVGLWLMARKYAEQWLVWLVVDIVCSILYFYKGIPFYGILYIIYSVIAVLGYKKWLKLMHADSNR